MAEMEISSSSLTNGTEEIESTDVLYHGACYNGSAKMKNSDRKVTKCYVRNLDTFNNILRERGLLE